MPASPWRAFGSPDANGDFAALLSYLPVKSYTRLFPVFIYTMQIMKQLAAAPGLIGYSLLAHPLSKEFFTLSAWQNDAALQAFVDHAPHQRIMIALAPHMAKTQFVRWPVKGSQIPLTWNDALSRLRTRAM